jgi:hypothetical protein
VKGVPGSVTHGMAAYRNIGCRCEICVGANAIYMREWRRARAGAEEKKQQRREREKRRSVREIWKGCLRCGLADGLMPLCEYCLVEIRGGRLGGGTPDRVFCEGAAEMYLSSARFTAIFAMEKEVEAALGLELDLLREALDVAPDDWERWRQNYVAWVRELQEMGDVMIPPGILPVARAA